MKGGVVVQRRPVERASSAPRPWPTPARRLDCSKAGLLQAVGMPPACGHDPPLEARINLLV